jgi:hypothetical protein
MSRRNALRGLGAFIAVGLVLIAATQVGAELPKRINYQGLLTDSSGNPLHGSYGVTFRIWDAASTGNQLWQETRTVETDSGGVFSVVLGTGTPIGVSFGSPRWLELAIDDEILLPRREIVSVASAFNAMNSDSLGGMHSSSYSLVGHTHDDRYFTEAELGTAGTVNQAGNPMDWTKLKNMPAGFADGTDDAGTGADNDWVISDNNMYSGVSGNVGIGTTTPAGKLEIGTANTGATPAIAINNTHPSGQDIIAFKFAGVSQAEIRKASGGDLFLDVPGVSAIRFLTNGIERVGITSAGRVGIGTNAPAYLLQVDNPSDANFGRAVYVVASGTGTGQQVAGIYGETKSSATTNAGAGVWGVGSSLTGVSAGVRGESMSGVGIGVFGRASSASGVNYGVYGRTLSPDGYSGYFLGGKNYFEGWVGLGSTTPLAPLQIYGNHDPLVLIDGPGGSQSVMTFATAGVKKWACFIPAGDADFSFWHYLAPTAQTYMKFDGTNGNIYIAPVGGRVGIGTDAPGTKLDVRGKVQVIASEAGSAASIFNSNASGTGLISVGNGLVGGSYLVSGSGVAGTGSMVGVYGYASSTGDNNQAGGRFGNGYGDYAVVAYRTTGGLSYKITGTGAVSTVMSTSAGRVSLVCPESPEAWIEDCGSGEIKSGTCHVDLDPTFLECVTVNDANPLKVFVQLTAPLEEQYYVKKGLAGFDVIVFGAGAATAGATFDFKVMAKWKGWEKVRFAEGPGPLETTAAAPHEEVRASSAEVGPADQ